MATLLEFPLNDPASVRHTAARWQRNQHKHWIGKDWESDTRTPADPFWLYKTRDCVGWLLSLMQTIKHAPQKGLNANHLLHQFAFQLANAYRGLWVLECVASDKHLDGLSRESRDLVADLLKNADAMRVMLGRKRKVTAQFRAELLGLCHRLMARYKEGSAKLPTEENAYVSKPLWVDAPLW